MKAFLLITCWLFCALTAQFPSVLAERDQIGPYTPLLEINAYSGSMTSGTLLQYYEESQRCFHALIDAAQIMSNTGALSTMGDFANGALGNTLPVNFRTWMVSYSDCILSASFLLTANSSSSDMWTSNAPTSSDSPSTFLLKMEATTFFKTTMPSQLVDFALKTPSFLALLFDFMTVEYSSCVSGNCTVYELMSPYSDVSDFYAYYESFFTSHSATFAQYNAVYEFFEAINAAIAQSECFDVTSATSIGPDTPLSYIAQFGPGLFESQLLMFKETTCAQFSLLFLTYAPLVYSPFPSMPSCDCSEFLDEIISSVDDVSTTSIGQFHDLLEYALLHPNEAIPEQTGFTAFMERYFNKEFTIPMVVNGALVKKDCMDDVRAFLNGVMLDNGMVPYRAAPHATASLNGHSLLAELKTHIRLFGFADRLPESVLTLLSVDEQCVGMLTAYSAAHGDQTLSQLAWHYRNSDDALAQYAVKTTRDKCFGPLMDFFTETGAFASVANKDMLVSEFSSTVLPSFSLPALQDALAGDVTDPIVLSSIKAFFERLIALGNSSSTASSLLGALTDPLWDQSSSNIAISAAEVMSSSPGYGELFLSRLIAYLQGVCDGGYSYQHGDVTVSTLYKSVLSYLVDPLSFPPRCSPFARTYINDTINHLSPNITMADLAVNMVVNFGFYWPVTTPYTLLTGDNFDCAAHFINYTQVFVNPGMRLTSDTSIEILLDFFYWYLEANFKADPQYYDTLASHDEFAAYDIIAVSHPSSSLSLIRALANNYSLFESLGCNASAPSSPCVNMRNFTVNVCDALSAEAFVSFPVPHKQGSAVAGVMRLIAAFDTNVFPERASMTFRDDVHPLGDFIYDWVNIHGGNPSTSVSDVLGAMSYAAKHGYDSFSNVAASLPVKSVYQFTSFLKDIGTICEQPFNSIHA